ncbi:MAG: hypothetical protein U0U25_11185 [Flavobacteriales bacterium]
MSDRTLDRATFEAIEAYVLERMDAAERIAFEQRLAADPLLRAELELEREHIRAVELGGLESMLKGIAAAERGASGGGHWPRLLKYAAVVALVAGGALWWALRTPLNERLFAEHFVADPGLPVAMGVLDDPAFADAMVAYKEAAYPEARNKFRALLDHDPGNDTLHYYLGCTALAMDDASEAILHLRSIVGMERSAFGAKARWYLFLAYVRKGDNANARSVDLDADPVFNERARAIKVRLGP